MSRQKNRLTLRRIAALIATVFACAYVTNGPQLYSRIVQRPRVQAVMDALQLPKEHFLGYGTYLNQWSSPRVTEVAIYLLPRNASLDLDLIDAKLAAIGFTKGPGGLQSISYLIDYLAADNRFSTERFTQIGEKVPADILLLRSQNISKRGFISVGVEDPRRLRNTRIVNGMNINDYYVLVIQLSDHKFGHDCEGDACLLPF